MIISIDIGTSYSSVCMLDREGKAVPVEVSTGISIYGGKYSLPSAVFVDADGTVLVGQAAMNSRKKMPQNFRSEFKRNIGQNVPIVLGNRSFLPEDLYTEIFLHMKKCAEKRGKGVVDKAYITYPASFGRAKQEKIIQAAKKAGLFHVELIDEPAAAAMCYGAKGTLNEGDILLVYDFGGGTFDAAVIKYANGKYESIVPAEGIAYCGGIDIDRAIYNDMRSKVPEELLRPLEGSKVNRWRFEGQLAELAVKIKHHLSSAEHAYEDIAVGFDVLEYHLGRSDLEKMTVDLLSQSIGCCRSILESAGLAMEEVSGILLAGGTSRMPLVQDMVREFAGKVPVYMDADPDLSIVQGALQLAGNENTDGKTRPEKQRTYEKQQRLVNEFIEQMRICADMLGAPDEGKKSKYGFVPGLDEQESEEGLRACMSDIGHGIFQVMVMGGFGVGKSTFLNALMHLGILSTGLVPETAVITKIIFEDKDERVIIYKNELDENGQQKVITMKNLSEFFEEYHVNPKDTDKFLRSVDHVEIHRASSGIAGSMIQLIDTPCGIQNPAAWQYVDKANALVFVISALMPLTQWDKEEIKQITKLRKNVFFVVNKINMLNTDEDVDAVKQYIREELRSFFLDENGIFDEVLYKNRVFYVDALASMNTRLGRRTTVGHSIEVMIPDEETSIPNFEASLQEFLTSENREKVALNAYLGQMADLYLVAERSVVERLEILAKQQGALERELRNLSGERESISRESGRRDIVDLCSLPVSLLRNALYVKERESRLLEIDKELCNIDDMLMSNKGTLGLEKERASCILHTFSKAISRMSELTGGVPLSAAEIRDMALRHRNS